MGVRRTREMNNKQAVAKDLMPWLFVGRGSAWKPFAKVRCEGGKCVWTEGKKLKRRRYGTCGA